jgi:hypothetical protein
MSFGFSIGDVVALGQLVANAYKGWKSACGNYATVTDDLAKLDTIMERVEAEARSPTSIFASSTDDLRGWESLSQGCHTTVTELHRILTKYKSLSTSRKSNWERIRMGTENMDKLARDLTKKTASMGAYLTVLGISSHGRVENSQRRVEDSQARIEQEVFPELLKRIDDLAAQMRKGNSTIKSSTTWTTYDGDDKGLWREFRRDLVKTGFRGRDVHKYKIAIQAYLGRLQRQGMLDEEIPDLFDPRLVVFFLCFCLDVAGVLTRYSSSLKGIDATVSSSATLETLQEDPTESLQGLLQHQARSAWTKEPLKLEDEVDADELEIQSDSSPNIHEDLVEASSGKASSPSQPSSDSIRPLESAQGIGKDLSSGSKSHPSNDTKPNAAENDADAEIILTAEQSSKGGNSDDEVIDESGINFSTQTILRRQEIQAAPTLTVQNPSPELPADEKGATEFSSVGEVQDGNVQAPVPSEPPIQKYVTFDPSVQDTKGGRLSKKDKKSFKAKKTKAKANEVEKKINKEVQNEEERRTERIVAIGPENNSPHRKSAIGANERRFVLLRSPSDSSPTPGDNSPEVREMSGYTASKTSLKDLDEERSRRPQEKKDESDEERSDRPPPRSDTKATTATPSKPRHSEASIPMDEGYIPTTKTYRYPYGSTTAPLPTEANNTASFKTVVVEPKDPSPRRRSVSPSRELRPNSNTAAKMAMLSPKTSRIYSYPDPRPIKSDRTVRSQQQSPRSPERSSRRERYERNLRSLEGSSSRERHQRTEKLYGEGQRYRDSKTSNTLPAREKLYGAVRPALDNTNQTRLRPEDISYSKRYDASDVQYNPRSNFRARRDGYGDDDEFQRASPNTTFFY